MNERMKGGGGSLGGGRGKGKERRRIDGVSAVVTVMTPCLEFLHWSLNCGLFVACLLITTRHQLYEHCAVFECLGLLPLP